MNAEYLLDTNILVYAVDSTPANAPKRKAAIALISQLDFGLSAQIMQEFYVTVTRKLKVPLSPEDALAFLDKLSAFPVVPTDYGLVGEAVCHSVKYKISYWDAAVIVAAERLQAGVLYSEDLNHGQTYGRVKVVNPFAGEKFEG